MTEANDIRTPRVVCVANEPGQPIRISVSADQEVEYFPITLVGAADLIENLTRALRERLPGGW